MIMIIIIVVPLASAVSTLQRFNFSFDNVHYSRLYVCSSNVPEYRDKCPSRCTFCRRINAGTIFFRLNHKLNSFDGIESFNRFSRVYFTLIVVYPRQTIATNASKPHSKEDQIFQCF